MNRKIYNLHTHTVTDTGILCVCVCILCVFLFSPSPLTGGNHHSPISHHSEDTCSFSITLSHPISLSLKTHSVVSSGARSLCVSFSLCLSLNLSQYLALNLSLSGLSSFVFATTCHFVPTCEYCFGYGVWLFVWWWEKGVPRHVAHGHTQPVGIICLNTLVRTGRTTHCIFG